MSETGVKVNTSVPIVALIIGCIAIGGQVSQAVEKGKTLTKHEEKLEKLGEAYSNQQLVDQAQDNKLRSMDERLGRIEGDIGSLKDGMTELLKRLPARTNQQR